MTEEFTTNPTVTVTNPAEPKYLVYMPLVALLFVSTMIAEILHLSFGLPFMAMLMGFVLVEFSLVKLFDIDLFVEKFSKYDLISSRVKTYGYLFPLIELAIGLAYIGHYNPIITSWIMLVVGAISSTGILISLNKKEKLTCACMGSAAEMPLGTVTVIENALMIGMAVAYIIGLH
jgi:hypothetical protein